MRQRKPAAASAIAPRTPLFASHRHFHLWEWATELHVAVGQASACSEGLSRLEDRRAATKLFEVETFDESNLLCLPNMGVF